MGHGKGMFLSSCGCCSRGLTDLLSHCHWMGSRRNKWLNLSGLQAGRRAYRDGKG